MSEIVSFALGFLCCCGVFYISQVRNIGTKTDAPVVKKPLFMARPDNKKAREASTLARRREMEEVITRGEGYPD